MAEETALSVLIAITALGAAVWLIALRFLAGSFRAARPGGHEGQERFDPAGSQPEGLMLGSVVVEGQPAALAARAAAVLAKETMGLCGQMKILQRGDDRVVFEGCEPMSASQSAGRIRGGQLRFTSAGHGRTEISYEIEVSASHWLLRLAVLFQVVGLIALAVGFCVIYRYVVRDVDPAVRVQAVQMFQVVHFLWPPFLFGALYRQGRRAARSQFDLLIHNLPYREG